MTSEHSAGKGPGRKGSAHQGSGRKGTGPGTGRGDGEPGRTGDGGTGGTGSESAGGAGPEGTGGGGAEQQAPGGKAPGSDGPGRPALPVYADRVYRSPSAMASGVALLALAAWLGGDALLNGSGRTPWAVLAGLAFFVPAVIAYTLRPAVFAGKERMLVRNPFRTVTVPWSTVESLQAGYTTEVIADGAKYQLWAIPVSLRARKSAQKHNARVQAGQPPRSGFLGFGRQAVTSEADLSERRATSDQAVDELRELAILHGEDGEEQAAPGPVVVRWAYELLAPAAAGAVALAVLYATR